ncbi:thioesterase family protein (plasmid) [Ralstonia sp. 25C]|uniref:thioesterase family protein n=1 Tax=Ralstonia sp. 25C TaxID=3447363 RepID=UPI003F74E4AF
MSHTTVHHDTVRAEWVDYNGHLRDAFYLLIFSFAVDAFIDRIGLTDAVRRARQRSIYTLESHIHYLREIKQGAQVRVDARVVAHDAKRIQLYLEMFADDREDAVAISEQMLLHVDTRGPASTPFDADVAERIAAFAALHAGAPTPPYSGRAIALPPRRN